MASRATIARTAMLLTGALLGIAAVPATLRLFSSVNPTTTALCLMLVVLSIATLGRLWLSIVAAAAATLAFNYFFLPPTGTFTVADSRNWITLVVFLLVAVIASKLAASAQARARDAVARRHEVTRLFDLTRDVLLTTETCGALDVLARHVARRFELQRIAICLPAEQGWAVHQGGNVDIRLDEDELNRMMANARGILEFDAQQRAYGGHARLDRDGGAVLVVPLRHGTKAVGLLAAGAPTLDLGALDAVAGVVAIAIERTQFLDEREAANRVRQKADLAANLLASLSHDLRTPLTAIRVAVENLRTDLAPQDRRTQADAALVELERLTRLFQDILDMARIDAAAVDVEPQWVTPSDIVDAAMAHVRHALEGRHVQVDAEGEYENEVDPRIASVALSHLLENAAQYSPPDSDIVVTARAEPDGVRAAVTDHGAGLDPGELEHLFERFYRGRAARQQSPGTGMGLAITRGLLTAVGGRVWAENVAGGGARFGMLVPGRRRMVRREGRDAAANTGR